MTVTLENSGAKAGSLPVDSVVANQPAVLAGVLDINASVKGARFVRNLDDIIEPQETRVMLIRALASLRGKRASRHERKHGNIPL